MSANGLRRYPAYKDPGVEWLGEVPEHWEVRRLGATTERLVAGTWGSDPTGLDDIVCVRVADFDRQRWGVDLREPTLRSVPLGERQGRLLAAGDLLLEKSGGGDLQPVGAVVHFDHDQAAVASNFIGRMRVRKQNSARYVLYLNSVLYALRITVRSIKQTTGIQNLDVGAYLGESVPLPPLTEQAAIARFLDAADRRIRRYIRAKERLIELLKERKRALIHEAVTGRIDVRTGQPYPAYKDSGVESIGKVPAHWEVRRLSTVAVPKSVRARHQHRELLSVYLNQGVIRFADAPERRANPTSLDLSQYQSVDPGDLVLNNQQAWRGSVGVSCLAGIVSPAYLVLSLTQRMQSRFADLLFRDHAMVAQYVVSSRGVGSIQRNIYWPHLKGIAIPLPSLPEQRAIARFLDTANRRIRRYISATQRQIALLKEYRTRLIADVVTGKLDVREAAADLPETDPLATNRDRADTIPTGSNPHPTEHDVTKEAYA